MNGTPFDIGGRGFVVPRLRVAAFERAVSAIQAADKAGGDADPFGVARLDAICGGIVDLLRENYPNLSIDEVKELAYVDEMAGILGELVKAGGKRQGEAAAP